MTLLLWLTCVYVPARSQISQLLTVSTLTHPSKSGPPSPLSCLRHHQFVLGQCLSVEIDP